MQICYLIVSLLQVRRTALLGRGLRSLRSRWSLKLKVKLNLKNLKGNSRQKFSSYRRYCTGSYWPSSQVLQTSVRRTWRSWPPCAALATSLLLLLGLRRQLLQRLVCLLLRLQHLPHPCSISDNAIAASAFRLHVRPTGPQAAAMPCSHAACLFQNFNLKFNNSKSSAVQLLLTLAVCLRV